MLLSYRGFTRNLYWAELSWTELPLTGPWQPFWVSWFKSETLCAKYVQHKIWQVLCTHQLPGNLCTRLINRYLYFIYKYFVIQMFEEVISFHYLIWNTLSPLKQDLVVIVNHSWLMFLNWFQLVRSLNFPSDTFYVSTRWNFNCWGDPLLHALNNKVTQRVPPAPILLFFNHPDIPPLTISTTL